MSDDPVCYCAAAYAELTYGRSDSLARLADVFRTMWRTEAGWVGWRYLFELLLADPPIDPHERDRFIGQQDLARRLLMLIHERPQAQPQEENGAWLNL